MPDKFVILVVDDNASNRFTMRELLAKLPDCEVVDAESGGEALIRTVEDDIHLILLDVQMPGMDGFETARHLQMTERTRHIPIVFVTAVFKSEAFIQHGYAIGAVDYLTKPLDDNLLLNRVRLYQRVHRHERELVIRVAQLQRQEQELAASSDAAEASNRAKSVFLANVSHELRTPLNAILGFAQILRQDAALAEDHRRELETIHRSGCHLLGLINDVLEISRIEAGRTTAHDEDFDLNDCLSSVEQIIRVRAEYKALDFTVGRQGTLPGYVRGDAHHLRQVLLNLLGNAIKFTDEGSVTLRLQSLNGHIRFQIIDTGCGIPLEDQTRIFQAFYQTDIGIAKRDGTGLGLTISRDFVRMMGGEICVYSELGKGSMFEFSLPLPEVAAPVDAMPQNRVVGMAEGQLPVRVLVVEDHADSRELITLIMSRAGFEVRSVEDGQKAIEAFESWHPQFIWMDMRMPVLDGYEATRIIRSMPGGQTVKIAAITASAFRENRDAILGAGCDDLLIKPVAEESLFRVMKNLLGLRFRYESEAVAAQPQMDLLNGALDLSCLTSKQRRELAAATALLDKAAVCALAEGIRLEHSELAKGISALADQYRFDVLAKLL